MKVHEENKVLAYLLPVLLANNNVNGKAKNYFWTCTCHKKAGYNCLTTKVFYNFYNSSLFRRRRYNTPIALADNDYLCEGTTFAKNYGGFALFG